MFNNATAVTFWRTAMTLLMMFFAVGSFSKTREYVGSQESFEAKYDEKILHKNVYLTGERNLVVLNSLGRSNMVPLAYNNIVKHFPGWDCIVMVYADDAQLSDSSLEIFNANNRCTVQRMVGLKWGEFLRMIPPPLTRQYANLAIVLDDVFAPFIGPHAVKVPKLLDNMKKYNLGVISPAIIGSAWSSMKARETGCLYKADLVEIFFTIYSREAWNCMQGFNLHTNKGGWCCDLCFEKYCGVEFSQAVDHSMQAYHMKRKKSKLAIKAPPLDSDYYMQAASTSENITLSELVTGTKGITTGLVAKNVFYKNPGNKDMCAVLDCPTKGRNRLEILECK
eukprot:CFRG4762T1